ncbi:hypothetical protein Lesp02_50210 [Lentzea sp. NBRC 105346]|uniref:hypothetical protein n=1 Tax=Lentzea sp. NBRC 105346 TaxID=3032205 RepID=UPI0024A47302|nr:hypothetical protein [Lentzea sp. NBRC 105346]GLZ32833.1 hypothetical protein Lesp02_50210 [Lentzea sp. NBRC 105346]
MTEALLRRAAAAVLVAVATATPIGGYLLLLEWNDRSSEPLQDYLVGGGGIWLTIGLALCVCWNRVTVWPVITRWAAVPGMFFVLVAGLKIGLLTSAPVALGLLAVTWAIAAAVRLVTTRPVTTALIASRLEIPFETRGLSARLVIQQDRLVLDSMRSRWKRSRDVVAVPWTALQSVRLEQVNEATTWQVLVYAGDDVGAKALDYDVSPGPALRIVGTARELLVPVTGPVGEVVIRAIEARSAGVEVSDEPVDAERWNAKIRLRWTGVLTLRQRRAGLHHRTDYRPWGLIAVIGFLLAPSVTAVIAAVAGLTGFDELYENIAGWKGVLGFGVIGAGFAFLIRLPLRQYRDFQQGNAFIEAFPEPPPPPARTGTTPKARKRKR